MGIQKATQNIYISVKILQENAVIFAERISQFYNESINPGKFPDVLKQVDVTPVFKKDYEGSKDNY